MKLGRLILSLGWEKNQPFYGWDGDGSGDSGGSHIETRSLLIQEVLQKEIVALLHSHA